MVSNNKKLIAVIGATGQQGGGVVRALQAREQFKVRALTRDPSKHRELADAQRLRIRPPPSRTQVALSKTYVTRGRCLGHTKHDLAV